MEILVGLILIVGAIYGSWVTLPALGTAAVEFLKGGIVWFVILIGLLFLIIGISDLKE